MTSSYACLEFLSIMRTDTYGSVPKHFLYHFPVCGTQAYTLNCILLQQSKDHWWIGWDLTNWECFFSSFVVSNVQAPHLMEADIVRNKWFPWSPLFSIGPGRLTRFHRIKKKDLLFTSFVILIKMCGDEFSSWGMTKTCRSGIDDPWIGWLLFTPYSSKNVERDIYLEKK